jgi:Ca-activated chloride channel homolog
MMDWTQLEWSRPAWALLALQPVVMALLLKLRRNQVLHYADAHLLAWVVRGRLGGQQHLGSSIINFAGWFMLACALAGPRLPLQSDPNRQVSTRHEMDIMVILDVSPSMLAQDVSPQRLQRAKLELLDLLPRLHGERLGLIAFSGSAVQIMPLSRDYAALRYYLQIADPALFDQPGSAIASALELAIKKLPSAPAANRAILLLTDADTNALSGPLGSAAQAAVEKLADAKIRLYILGVGTAEGAIIPLANGGSVIDEGVEVISRLDETGFAALAKKTGGEFVGVEDGDADWRSLYDRGLLTLAGSQPSTENVQAWQELYAVFLLPALLLLSFPYRPRFLPRVFNKLATPKLLIFCCLFGLAAAGSVAPNKGEAAELDAYLAYRAKDLSLAQTLYGSLHGYAARIGEGAAAYRRKDYAHAIRQFAAALLEASEDKQREQALFNLGNSYFMAGGYRAAADAFYGVLKYSPTNKAAQFNLALSDQKLAEGAKATQKSAGILGRRGRQTGGLLGEDASDKTLFIDPAEEKKIPSSSVTDTRNDAGLARLQESKRLATSQENARADSDSGYLSALKKLELAQDKPLALHKALAKIEAAREYVPTAEMSPW